MVWGSSDSCLPCPTAWQRIIWLDVSHISARVSHCSDKLSKEPSLVVWSPAGGPLTRWELELGAGEKMIFLTPWPWPGHSGPSCSHYGKGGPASGGPCLREPSPFHPSLISCKIDDQVAKHLAASLMLCPALEEIL